ncbi:sugar kinase, partial [Bifidobacterium animalis]|nr:sugar kinase [Bifidobacterium animalis]
MGTKGAPVFAAYALQLLRLRLRLRPQLTTKEVVMLNLRRGIGTHEPSVISLGQVWVDIMLDVDEIPEQGG